MKKFTLSQLFSAIALILANAVFIAPAVDAAPLSPDTPIGDDGKVVAAAVAPELFNKGLSLAYEGTGVTPKVLPRIPETEIQYAPVEGFTPESVIGVDSRVRVTATTTYPSRAIAHLVVTFPSGTGTCTGWFIGPRTVATAGHCVYDAVKKQWATTIKVYPGRNGSITPYGYTTAYRKFTVTGWTTSGNPAYDYGAIQTNAPMGNTVGWFGYRWQASNSFPGVFTVRGYPGDKTYGTMWTMSGGITAVNTYRQWYQMDTYGGQSGSPLYQVYNNICCYGVGVHTYGTSVPPYFGNSATRITSTVFNNFNTWRARAYP